MIAAGRAGMRRRGHRTGNAPPGAGSPRSRRPAAPAPRRAVAPAGHQRQRPLTGPAREFSQLLQLGGGSNGSRVRAWKIELARLATETGLAITVAHLPPGTSKWNKIEHRLSSQIAMNWRGRPLTKPSDHRRPHRSHHHSHRTHRPRRTRHRHLPHRHRLHEEADRRAAHHPPRLPRRLELHHHPRTRRPRPRPRPKLSCSPSPPTRSNAGRRGDHRGLARLGHMGATIGGRSTRLDCRRTAAADARRGVRRLAAARPPGLAMLCGARGRTPHCHLV